MRRDPNQPQYCDACFTGEYPTRLTDRDRTGEVRHLNVLAESA
jgi:amidophosphoribosyltransferase